MALNLYQLVMYKVLHLPPRPRRDATPPRAAYLSGRTDCICPALLSVFLLSRCVRSPVWLVGRGLGRLEHGLNKHPSLYYTSRFIVSSGDSFEGTLPRTV